MAREIVYQRLAQNSFVHLIHEQIAPAFRCVGVPGKHLDALRPGLLDSGVTRQAGFVSIVDIAPAIAALVHAPLVDQNVDGRPVNVVRGGGDAEARIDFLVTANENAGFREKSGGVVVFSG